MPIKAHSSADKTQGIHPTFSTFSDVRHTLGYDECTGEAALFGGLWDKDHGFWEPPAKWLHHIKEISDDGGRNNFGGVVIFSVTLRLLYPWGQNRLNSLNSRLDGPQGRSVRFAREKGAFFWWNGRKMRTDMPISGSSIGHWLLTKMKYQHQSTDACFKASAAMWMRSEIFWHVTQNRLVIPSRHCGRKPSVLSSRFLDCLTLEYRTDRLSRNVGTEFPFYLA